MARRQAEQSVTEEIEGQQYLGEERHDVQGSAQSPGSDVEPVVTGEIAAAGPAVRELTEWLADHASRSDVDTWQDMERAVAKILSGDSAEDVLKKDLPISGKTFLNRPFLLHGFTITESDYEEGSPFYANLDVTVNAGAERHILNVGGIKVLAKLKRLSDIGEWPYAVMLTGDTTKRGFTVLDLVEPTP